MNKNNIIYIIIKLLLIVSLINICISFNKVDANECKQCLKVGESCNIDKGEICEYGSLCNTTICIKYLKEGEQCDEYTICDLGLGCREDGIMVKRCFNMHFATRGESCTHDNDCVGYFKCNGGKCQYNSPTYCDSDRECDYNQYCQNNNCKNQKLDGQQCSSSQECQFTSLCVSGVCNSQSSVLGQSCQYSSQCGNGYNCKSQVCTQFAAPTDNLKQCNYSYPFSSSCNSQYLSCFCDGMCHQDYSYPSSQEYTDLYKCSYKNKARIIENLYSQKSSISKFCRKEICASQSFTPKINNNCEENYSLDKYCSENPDSSSTSSSTVSSSSKHYPFYHTISPILFLIIISILSIFY